MENSRDLILSALKTFYCTQGLPETTAMELSNSDIETISYIERDEISQERYQAWYNCLVVAPGNFSYQSTDDTIKWGKCLKDCSHIWPCIPSKELSIEDKKGFYTDELRHYFDYIKNHIFYDECAIKHAARVFDCLIQLGCISIYDFTRLSDYLYSTFPKTEDFERFSLEGYIDFSTDILERLRPDLCKAEKVHKLFNSVKNNFFSYLEKTDPLPFILTSMEVRDFIKTRVFTINDLSRIIPKDIIEKCLSDWEYIRNIEFQSMLNEWCEDEPALSKHDGVDVYFLGAPSTGKSCLISGVLNAAESTPTARISGNPHIFTLLHEHKEGIAPLATSNDTVIPIEVSLDYKGSKQLFNIIHMSGEPVMEIASSRTLDMNTKVGSLLSNDNPKILFFVIDPEYGFQLWQEKPLEGLIHVLEDDIAIMKNVVGIHLIVTKCDMLKQDCPLNEMLESRGYKSIIYLLNELCKIHKINRKHNYTPKIIPFSIGKFYTKDFFVEEKKYSQNVLEVILESMPETKANSFINLIRRLFKS